MRSLSIRRAARWSSSGSIRRPANGAMLRKAPPTNAVDPGCRPRSVLQLISGRIFSIMRHLLTATATIFASAGLASAAPPALTPAQHDATHAMFEHIIDLPTVIGRHRVPEEAQFIADQFK